MRKLNIFLGIVFLILVGFVAFFFIGGTLSGTAHTITAPAADHPDAFASIRNVLSADAAPQRFTDSIPQSPEGCTLVDITITLNNPGIFAAEWLDVRADGLPGDIAVYSLTGQGSGIPGGGTGQLNLKILTTEPASAPRTLHLSYYIYGMQRTVRITG